MNKVLQPQKHVTINNINYCVIQSLTFQVILHEECASDDRVHRNKLRFFLWNSSHTNEAQVVIFFWDISLWDFGIKEMNKSEGEDFQIFTVGWLVMILEHEYKLRKLMVVSSSFRIMKSLCSWLWKLGLHCRKSVSSCQSAHDSKLTLRNQNLMT